MKAIIFCAALLLVSAPLPAADKDDQLSFEGKASAQITRNVSVPYPIIVQKALARIGDNVSEGQRLLEYRLEEKTERALQHDLYWAGGAADRAMQRATLQQELLTADSKRKLSAELAAKGLGSTQENAVNARQAGYAHAKLKAFDEKSRAAQSDFSYRLRELERDLGHQLKPGQKIPSDLFMTAPIDGTVVSMSPQARPDGQLSGTAFTLARLNPIQVQIQVHESEITRLKVGQEASVELASDENIKLPGHITMLSWQPTNAAVAVPSFYHVWLDVENPDHILKPGYKVIVNVEPDAD